MRQHQCPNTTPGPWSFDLYLETPDGECTLHLCKGPFEDKGGSILEGGWVEGDAREMTANSHLIAAAPLMYEALANLENDDAKRMPATAWKLVQDALAAARGETGS